MIEEKRVEASTPVKPGSTFARRISDVANPLFVALPTFLVAALATAPNVLQALFWWGITAVGISVAPFLFIWQGVRQGRYTDHHVSRREQRLIPLLFGLGCMVVVFVLLLLLAVP
ncbi:MAG: hypothetical protein J2P36_26955, partial [Ktedonobacteraceae bacterium]|nr:hypothetical protein [Ktedonobacteraceae bacterium]